MSVPKCEENKPMKWSWIQCQELSSQEISKQMTQMWLDYRLKGIIVDRFCGKPFW